MKTGYWDHDYVSRNEIVELKCDWSNCVECLIAARIGEIGLEEETCWR